MDQIVEQLVQLNDRDCLDKLGIIGPFVVSILVFIQSWIIARRNNKLQKLIHNRDVANQAHEDIFRIHRTYYDFCDVIYVFYENVRCADIGRVSASLNDTYNLKKHIIQNLDMARMLFERKDPETYKLIKDAFNSQIKVIDMFQDYFLSGRLAAVTEKAWDKVLENKNELFRSIARYNINELIKIPQLYEEYIALCNTDELKDIKKAMDTVIEQQESDEYTNAFEKYLYLERL